MTKAGGAAIVGGSVTEKGDADKNGAQSLDLSELSEIDVGNSEDGGPVLIEVLGGD